MYRVKQKVVVFVSTPEKEQYSIKDIAIKKNLKQFEVKRLISMIFPDLELNTKLKIPLSLIDYLLEQHEYDTPPMERNEKYDLDEEFYNRLKEAGYNNKQKAEIGKIILRGIEFDETKFPPTMHWKNMREIKLAGSVDKYFLSNYMQKQYKRQLKKKKIPAFTIKVPVEEVANAKYKHKAVLPRK